MQIYTEGFLLVSKGGFCRNHRNPSRSTTAQLEILIVFYQKLPNTSTGVHKWNISRYTQKTGQFAVSSVSYTE